MRKHLTLSDHKSIEKCPTQGILSHNLDSGTRPRDIWIHSEKGSWGAMHEYLCPAKRLLSAGSLRQNFSVLKKVFDLRPL